MNQALKEYMESILSKENIRYREPMRLHTSFRTGGEAACFVEIGEAGQLQKLLNYLYKTENEFFLLGNGTNLLVSDKGYEGIVIQLGNRFSQIRVEGERIYAQAGALLSRIAKEAQEAGLSGMEFASGIPGSLGGGLVMNAGAYDGEMKQIVEEVTVLNKEGEELILDRDTMEFGYRTSIVRKYPLVITQAVLKLEKGDPERIWAKMDEFAAKRRKKQPLEFPSAGSTFKRPEGYFAGKLIMDSGMRGYRIGGAQVSEKHCGFIINTGNAASADIKELIEEIQERVKERFHVTLEPEVVFLGDF